MAMTENCAGRHVDLTEAAAILREADNLLIVSHRRPDGDCLGSTIGLLYGLRSLGKTVRAFNAGPLHDRWEWLDGIAEVEQSLPEGAAPGLTVFVDCGAANRVADGFAPTGPTLNIDHHLTNSRFGDANFIDVDACAVGEQILALLGELGVALDARIATALYLSIMTDTGGFRFSNTTHRAFHAAGQLVAAGADPGAISQQVYETRTRGEVLLTGKVLGNVRYEHDGALAWGEILMADIAAAGGPENEPEGLSGELRSVRGVEISVLINELPDGARASYRGKGAVDCSAAAGLLGGGGHFNAAGTTVTGTTYEAARDAILDAAAQAIAKWRASR